MIKILIFSQCNLDCIWDHYSLSAGKLWKKLKFCAEQWLLQNYLLSVKLTMNKIFETHCECSGLFESERQGFQPSATGQYVQYCSAWVKEKIK